MLDAITQRYRRRARPAKYFDFGAQCVGRMSDILPESVAATAAATCRFQLRGLNANGNEWGYGVIVTLQTYGNAPIGLGGVNQPAVHYHGDWIETGSHEAANVILGCFGLTIIDVYARFGKPTEGERILLDLFEIVQALTPALAA